MGKQKREKYHLWHKTPYDGVPGFFPAILRFLYQIEGPAQLGNRNEAPYLPPSNPVCPVCKAEMARHQVERGGPGKRTHLRCP